MTDLDKLKVQLMTSGIQQQNFPLFQVLSQLIDYLRQNIDLTAEMKKKLDTL